ncbi:hypothetical protein EOL96_01900 [Candidatus Saccharibacteria bacterium]|nr:hypothetical protein [Candidatus Saccharibacteria bacterium]
MFLVGLFTWWYGVGWKQRVLEAREHIESLYDYFSVDLLVRTLFSPFRQISAGSVQGPLVVQFRAWVDRLISRVIGAIVRSGMIIIGVIALIISVTLNVILIILWGIVPFAPVIGVVLMSTGWIPWHI